MKVFKISLEIIVATLVGVLACLIFINVILRYCFHTSIIMTDELGRFLFVWVIFMAGILMFMEKGHVAMDYFIGKLNPVKKVYVNIISQLGILCCCVLLVIGTFELTVENWINIMPVTGLPEGLFYLSALIFGLVCGLITFYRLIQDVICLKKGNLNAKNSEACQ